MTTEKEISIWTNTLLAVLEGKKREEKKLIIKKLIKILKNRKKEHLLPKIFKRFETVYLKNNRIEFSFSREQSIDLIKEIKDKTITIFGRDKNIEVKIDKDLIGGFRVKTANFLIKATIKDFLNELKEIY